MKRVEEEWERATEGKRTAQRIMRGRYRDDPSRYCDIVFFGSYEEAEKNSELPETQEFTEKQRKLVDGDITYFDLEVFEDEKL